MTIGRRVVLVTGAAGGLGKAICVQLARDGFDIAAADVNLEAACQVAAEIAALGVECLPVEMDVSSESSVKAGFAALQDRFGRLDAVVSNAGISGKRTPLETADLADWEHVLRINLIGTFLVAREAIGLLRAGEHPRIVNMASHAARARTGTGKAQYAASKAGIVGLSRVLADELGPDGITVNCVAPSRTMTPLTVAAAGADVENYFKAGAALTALGRLAVPEDIAGAVSYLCSPQAAFITGTVIDVNGGAFMT